MYKGLSSGPVSSQKQVTRSPFPTLKDRLGDNNTISVKSMGVAKHVIAKADLKTDWLSERQIACVRELTKAANAIDGLLYRQLTPHGLEIKETLERSLDFISEPGVKEKVLDYYRYLVMNHCYYDQVQGNKKFVPQFTQEEFLRALDPQNAEGEGQLAELKAVRKDFKKLAEGMYSNPGEKRPDGAQFYPKDLTDDDIKKAVEAGNVSSEDVNAINTIVRGEKLASGDWNLTTVPFEQEYRETLEVAAVQMNKAADVIEPEDAAFAEYLRKRAQALLSGKKEDFDESDVLWIELKSPGINFVVGPIETYNDMLRSAKASYQSMLYIRNNPETEKVKAILDGMMQKFIGALPCEDKYRNRSTEKPPEVEFVDVVTSTGSTNRPRTTVAFSLPNDPKIRAEHGSRLTQTVNLLDAKTESTDVRKAILDFVDTETGGFTRDELKEGMILRIAFHEYGHPLGVCLDGDGGIIDSRIPLGEYHGPFEEMKATVLGINSATVAVQENRMNERQLNSMLMEGVIEAVKWAYSSRDLSGAHAKATLMEFNYLFSKDAITIKDGKYSVDFKKAVQAEKELAATILRIQGEGDKQGAKGLEDKYGKIPEHMKGALEKLDSKDLPKFVYVVFPEV
ncbi:MAG: hypothetical protein ABIG39_04700 [Candidatus Micrarchaeota archaeon]